MLRIAVVTNLAENNEQMAVTDRAALCHPKLKRKRGRLPGRKPLEAAEPQPEVEMNA
jgi:hypothetical protein